MRRAARYLAISSKKSIWALKKKREARRECVDVHAPLDRALDVRKAVLERERELLLGRRAGFADVVAGDRDRVPARHLLRAPLDHVGDQAHRRLDREAPFLLGDVLLEDVRLDRPAELVRGDALLLRGDDVEREHDRGRGVDGHRDGDLVERDSVEEGLHVVHGVHGDSLHPHLAKRAGVVGVEAHQARHVEGGREARLAVVEQVAEARVCLLDRAEAGELAHRPQAPAVHRLVHAARVRELAGLAEVALGIPAPQVLLGIERLDRMPRHRVVERLRPLGLPLRPL